MKRRSLAGSVALIFFVIAFVTVLVAFGTPSWIVSDYRYVVAVCLLVKLARFFFVKINGAFVSIFDKTIGFYNKSELICFLHTIFLESQGPV